MHLFLKKLEMSHAYRVAFYCALFFCSMIAGLLNAVLYAAETKPTGHYITLNATLDNTMLPSELVVFDSLFAGRSSVPDADRTLWSPPDQPRQRNNTLTCMSLDPKYGSCPLNYYWGYDTGSAPPMMGNKIVLTFTQKGTGKEVDLSLEAFRFGADGTLKQSPWNAAAPLNVISPIYMRVTIPKTELSKLTPGTSAQPWEARLFMFLNQFQSCPTLQNPEGCPADGSFNWQANININFIDSGLQDIFFPEFGAQPAIVNLGNFGLFSPSAVSINKDLDMCLYDGSNSSSSEINLIFSDEGKAAPGRPVGAFSIYNEQGKIDETSRIDYELSIVDPKTGMLTPVKNGELIQWTGVSAGEGMIKTRSVSMPGISGVVQCVPAPLNFSVPHFLLSSKVKGHYSGKLNIIYSTGTQSSITDTII
ncbi:MULTISPECIES: CfaE/CblD family pilus tip adhesin [Enterobacter cloacae complex]|uniref:CfaE/CblD family pilus tip adhesin n=1 Tax=Enterobacter cloacae complex TaxID=354276 RepID=UPI002DB8CEC6|nr:CfaE/CblD family pilus tip adhesin [Enterobacter roggenkampii]MEB6513682.1 hypothetical protein [Enterobacter roggenkampii]